MTQCQKILKYMDDFGSITPLEAMNDLGVMRLAARISDIKKMGIEISKDTVSGRNRYNKPIKFARYKKVSA